MNTTAKPSPALAYLSAAITAFPKTLGDRERAGLLDRVFLVAIDSRMGFDTNDGALLERHPYQLSTCVGVFDPMRDTWYHRACVRGGTFARMWEKHNAFAPWMAPSVHSAYFDVGELKNNRIAPGLGVVVPAALAEGDDLQATRQGEVWWCTSIAKDRITLCRYPGRLTLHPTRAEGKPAKRRTFTREEWEQFTASLAPVALAA